MVAASAALTLSGVPFMGPIGGARVGYINGEYMLNPHLDEMAESKLDLVVAGTADAVLMVESEAQELPEDVMLGAVMFGHRGFQPVIDAIIKLAEVAAKEPRDHQPAELSDLEAEMLRPVEADLRAAYKNHRQAGALRRGRRRQGEGEGALRSRRPTRRRRRGRPSRSPACSRSCRPRSSAGTSSTPAAHRRPRPEDGPPDRSRKSASCRARTARRCSPAARRRRSWSPRSAPARTSSMSTR